MGPAAFARNCAICCMYQEDILRVATWSRPGAGIRMGWPRLSVRAAHPIEQACFRLPFRRLGTLRHWCSAFGFLLPAVFIASWRRRQSVLRPTRRTVVRCQSGRRRRAHALISVRRSNCTCRFPAYSFHEDAPERGRGAREGMSENRLTKPNSSYSVAGGNCFHPIEGRIHFHRVEFLGVVGEVIRALHSCGIAVAR
jgi:hypothetical protein